MKRLFGIMIVIVLVFTVTACSSDKTDKNIISISELTEREESILTTTSERAFVFDYNVNKDYNEITVWIEKYELGELVDAQLGELSTQVEEHGFIIFTVSKDFEQDNPLTFNLGIGDDGGTSAILGSDSNTTGLASMSSTWDSVTEEKTFTDNEEVLAHIAYLKHDDVVSSLSTDFYTEPEAHLNELEKYDITYLFKAKFVK